VIGVFTDQAYNLILLAEDEARMLGHPEVEPQHLLLALARRGSVEALLRKRGIAAADIHSAIVGAGGLRDDLVLGRVPSSPETEAALDRAVAAAADRGVLGPSSEHVLLGLGEDADVRAVLRQVGVVDVERFVDAAYPDRLAPLSLEQVQSYALRVGAVRSPPRPGPIPPVFERFTTHAHAAIEAGEHNASSLQHENVAPCHLLLGMLDVSDCLAARVMARNGLTLSEMTQRARQYGPAPSFQATGIFTDEARRAVAEDALKHAHSHGQRSIGTGHLLLAILDAPELLTSQIIGPPPLAQRLVTEMIEALPGDEHQ
jgi:ATP-dependent Clp protease ATP-binding subunit ClpA